MKSQTGYCNRWGAEWGARRVHGLTADEKKAIQAGQTVTIDGPEYKGVAVRRVVLVCGKYFARMPNIAPSRTETWIAWLDGKRAESVLFEVPLDGAFDVAQAGAMALGVDVCEELNVKRE